MCTIYHVENSLFNLTIFLHRLYTAWRRHFDSLGESEKQLYNKPLSTPSVGSVERIVANVFKATKETKVGITLVMNENEKVVVDRLTGLFAATGEY